MKVLIDASRNRSGGAVAHILGILNEGINPSVYGIEEIVLFSYQGLLDKVRPRKHITKETHNYLNRNLLFQYFWQIFLLRRYARRNNVDIVLYTDASAVVSFKPSIVMSRDMLSFEPGHIEMFPDLKSRLRLKLIGLLQIISLRRATNAVFLTQYAKSIITEHTGPLSSISVIPHGVSNVFNIGWSRKKDDKFIIVYVSNSSYYKHQINVMKAFIELSKVRDNIFLKLIGARKGISSQEVVHFLQNSLTDRIEITDYLNREEIIEELRDSSLALFASSCENMPNTLIEKMQTGIPIVCSSRGPMPEILEDTAFYFDPFDVSSIKNCLERAIVDYEILLSLQSRRTELASEFSWKRCSIETFKNLKDVYESL